MFRWPTREMYFNYCPIYLNHLKHNRKQSRYSKMGCGPSSKTVTPMYSDKTRPGSQKSSKPGYNKVYRPDKADGPLSVNKKYAGVFVGCLLVRLAITFKLTLYHYSYQEFRERMKWSILYNFLSYKCSYVTLIYSLRMSDTCHLYSHSQSRQVSI